MTGEIKGKCIEQLQTYVKGFQERRSQVTEELVDLFMSQRPLEWKANPRAQIALPVGEGPKAAAGEGEDGKLSKNALKKLEKQKQIDAKKAQKAQEKTGGAAAAPES